MPATLRSALGRIDSAAEYLLVLDEFGSRRTQALDHQIEAIGLVRRRCRHSRPRRAGIRACPGHRPISVSCAGPAASRSVGAWPPLQTRTTMRLAAAILEVLLERVRQRRGLPQAAEHALVVIEAGDRDRLIDRPLERPADEGGDCGCGAFDRCLRPQLLCGVRGGKHQLGHALPSKPNANVAQRRHCRAHYTAAMRLVRSGCGGGRGASRARWHAAAAPRPRAAPPPACARFPPA